MTMEKLPGSGSSPRGCNVAAVFATMNRKEVAAECVRLLSEQTERPAKIIVTDNASVDGTPETLENLARELGIDLTVIRSPGNLGNAGGIKLAMDQAFSEGHAHIWILDDDSWPERDALASLLTPEGPPEGLRASLVLEPDSERVSWPCEIRTGSGRWKLAGEASDFPVSWLEIRRSWLGLLVPREVYEDVGPVNGDLFLRGEDEDYPRRLEAAGHRFWISTASVLRHPFMGALLSFSWGAQRICLERNLSPDKLYYRIRNMLWLKSQESGWLVSCILACGYLLLLVGGYRPFIPAFRTFLEAVQDAATGRLGRRPEKRG